VQLKKRKEIKMLENKLTKESKIWGGRLWKEKDKNENLKRKRIKKYLPSYGFFHIFSVFSETEIRRKCKKRCSNE